ncbi:hypothetical protein P5V15_015523 [Pogonomyrmex californicus]
MAKNKKRNYFGGALLGALTEHMLHSDGYKFLEIGINVSPPSYVEIALEDHREQELILSLETWKGLYSSDRISINCCETITKIIL